MKDAFMMSREELLAKTGTDSEKGLNPHWREKVFRSKKMRNLSVRRAHQLRNVPICCIPDALFQQEMDRCWLPV